MHAFAQRTKVSRSAPRAKAAIPARPQASAAAAGGWAAVPPLVRRVVQAPGRPLDPAARAFMESRFVQDFGSVRVHTDHVASQSAEAVAAQAYTVGSDVVFARGKYAPRRGEGRWLLAHELAHVVQQKRGDVAIQRKDAESDEREKWRKALSGKELPTARRFVEEKTTAFFVEGLIESSKVLEPYLKGKLAKTSVGKNFHIYGAREVFEAKANKLVGGGSGSKEEIGGFFHRQTDSIHLPPRASFGHALHEGIHKYSLRGVYGLFGSFLNEGVTQYFADRVQAEHGVKGKTRHEYGSQLACAKAVVALLKGGEKTLGEAYFQGEVAPMAEALNEKLGIGHRERIELVSKGKLCERILQEERAR